MLDKELVGSKICVLFFSTVFFPPQGGAREDQVTGTCRPDCRELGARKPLPI